MNGVVGNTPALTSHSGPARRPWGSVTATSNGALSKCYSLYIDLAPGGLGGKFSGGDHGVREKSCYKRG